MNKIVILITPALVAVLTIGLAGCNEAAKAPPPLAAEQVPQVLDNAFRGASAETTAAAAEAVTAVQSDDPATALESLQDLSARPDLSDEQRIASARAMAAYLQKAREAAEKGDKKADDALQQYRATK